MAEAPAPAPTVTAEPLAADSTALRTSAGDFSLHEYRLQLGDRTWSILHTGAVLSQDDEQHFLSEMRQHLPYGVALWPASIALAHDVHSRAAELSGRRVLELGAGTGLPGIVAASLGATVLQTDKHELALSIGEANAKRNRVTGLTHRLADWGSWDDTTRYDLILGADILYADSMHEALQRIFRDNLASGGRVLLADPFRKISLRLLEAMEADGWSLAMSKWTVAGAATPRPIGVFELTRP